MQNEPNFEKGIIRVLKLDKTTAYKLKPQTVRYQEHNWLFAMVLRDVNRTAADPMVKIRTVIQGDKVTKTVSMSELSICVIERPDGSVVGLDRKKWEQFMLRQGEEIEFVAKEVSSGVGMPKQKIAFTRKHRHELLEGTIASSGIWGCVVKHVSHNNICEYRMLPNQAKSSLDNNDQVKNKRVVFYLEERDGIQYAIIAKTMYKKWTDQDAYHIFEAGRKRGIAEATLSDVNDMEEINEAAPTYKIFMRNYELSINNKSE